MTLCALAVRRRRSPTGAERWAWRIALAGYALLTAGLAGSYWTPLLDESFLVLGVPGMLVGLIGSTLLGITLLRHRFRSRASAVLVAVWVPLMVGLSALVALGAAVMPMVWAWGLAGRALGRDTRLTGGKKLLREGVGSHSPPVNA